MDTCDAFARIYADHAKGVYLAALRVLGDGGLAEDVTQEVFLAQWRGSGYDERRGELGTYLRLLARSRALDIWRRNRVGERALAQLEDRTVLESSPTETPQQVVLRAADRERARDAVRSLPPDQRRAIGLAYWAGLTAQEAADIEGVPLGTAKSRVRLGLHKLARDPALAAT